MMVIANKMDLVPLSHNRFKDRVTRVAREVKEARVNSNQIRSRGIFSLTKTMSSATHQECIYQYSTMRVATAKEEVITPMMETRWRTTPRDMARNIATQATNALQRIQTKEQMVIMVR